jgi:uncharacterized protein YjbJ (UPF0337 family)
MTDRDKIEGEVKEKVGKLTDDESLEEEGRAQETLGDAKEKVKDTVDDVSDEVRDRL